MVVVVVLRGRKVVLSGRRQAELNCNNLKVTEAWSVPLVLNTREKASRTRIPQPPPLTRANKFICYRVQSSHLCSAGPSLIVISHHHDGVTDSFAAT